MVTPLSNAARGSSGSKAGTLGRLLRAGIPVPDGFVVPAHDRSFNFCEISCGARDQIEEELARLGDPPVAVRSSAADEDSVDGSAAGMYESFLGVRGSDDVIEAIAACRRSAASSRVRAYRRRRRSPEESTTGIPVLVQALVEAEASGVMFTPTVSDGMTRLESSWGLGLSVVGGRLTPDVFDVGRSGSVRASIGAKSFRSDSVGESREVETTAVSHEMRTSRTLNDEDAVNLAALGERVAAVLGGPQDIEWAIADGEFWIVQARPVTAAVPGLPDRSVGSGRRGNERADTPTIARRTAADPHRVGTHASEHREALVGTPGSHGTVTARARIVSGPAAFADLRPGEMVVCPFTDPAWTPLLSIAAGVVTETGGTLSHAAIVAREYGVPAVLGVPQARDRIADGDLITVDGTTGTVTMH